MEGTLGISDEEMENMPQTAQTAVVKGDFHNESLDDPVKESAESVCMCVYGPSSHAGCQKYPLFIHSAQSTHSISGRPPPPPPLRLLLSPIFSSYNDHILVFWFFSHALPA